MRILIGIFALVVGLAIIPMHIEANSCDEGGRFLEQQFRSSTLQSDVFYSVYLPPCYDVAGDPYPVTYLMHGSNDDHKQWQRLGIVETMDNAILMGKIAPMIVVMPFGDRIANENRFDGVSWDQIFIDDLLPHIDVTYHTDARRESRGIGGISRGGFWAYVIALRHPELFMSAGAHSGYLDVAGIPSDYNPLALAKAFDTQLPMRFWLDRGAADFVSTGLDELHDFLDDASIAHQYTVYGEGTHNNAYWQSHIEEYVAFYGGHDTGSTANSKSSLPDGEGFELFVPAVSFASLETTITGEQLDQAIRGQLDTRLVLADDVVNLLAELGVEVHPQTPVVENAALENRLWRDKTLYTILPFDQLTMRYRMLWIDDVHPLHDLESYPLVFASETPNFHTELLSKITFSGVTALTRQTLTAIDTNGIEWAGGAIRSYVDHADFFHTSNEVSMVADCPLTAISPMAGPSSFCAKPQHFDLFDYLDVDIVELTGNHNNDYGYEAYLDTLEFFEVEEIAVVGGGSTTDSARTPLMLDHNGNRVVLLACNMAGPYYALVSEDPDSAGGVRPGAAYCDWDWLTGTLPVLSAQNDVVIVTVQHQEYDDRYVPTDAQVRDFRRMADLGADLVIGTAPHKPQTFEFYSTRRGSNALLHYGLGNLFFDQEFWGNVRFFMDTVYIYDGKPLTIDIFPGIIEGQARPRLMTAEERLNFLHFMFIQQNGF